jgi:hypothetical protein
MKILHEARPTLVPVGLLVFGSLLVKRRTGRFVAIKWRGLSERCRLFGPPSIKRNCHCQWNAAPAIRRRSWARRKRRGQKRGLSAVRGPFVVSEAELAERRRRQAPRLAAVQKHRKHTACTYFALQSFGYERRAEEAVVKRSKRLVPEVSLLEACIDVVVI